MSHQLTETVQIQWGPEFQTSLGFGMVQSCSVVKLVQVNRNK